MNKKKLDWLEKIDKTYPKAIYLVAGGVWFVVGALPYFGYSEPFKGEVGVQNFIILILSMMLLAITTCIVIYFVKKDRNDIDATIKKANKMLAEGRNKDILVLRKKENWSRSLWVEGKPYARLELGEIAKKAAINELDPKNLAEIYIDDLGWTYVSVERYKDAKETLEHGLQCAGKIQNNDDKNYWCAKAKRHLAGIEIEKAEYNEAEVLMNEAIQFANNIMEQQRKNEMLAGIYYGQSLRFLKDNKNKQNIETALSYAEQSENLRVNGELSRFVKIYSLKGNIYEAKNDMINAEEQYRNGLRISKDLKRTDEIIRNLLGLARVVESEKEKQQHIKNANNLLKKTPVPFRIDEREMKLIKL